MVKHNGVVFILLYLRQIAKQVTCIQKFQHRSFTLNCSFLINEVLEERKKPNLSLYAEILARKHLTVQFC